MAGGAAVSIAAPYIALPLVGFGSSGVVAGSVAAAWQASIGNVVAGSAFAALQSAGVAGLATTTMAVCGTVGSAVAGAAALVL